MHGRKIVGYLSSSNVLSNAFKLLTLEYTLRSDFGKPIISEIASVEDPEHGREGNTYTGYMSYENALVVKLREGFWAFSIGKPDGGYKGHGRLADIIGIKTDNPWNIKREMHNKLDIHRQNSLVIAGTYGRIMFSDNPLSRQIEDGIGEKIEDRRIIDKLGDRYDRRLPLEMAFSIRDVLNRN